MTPRPLRTTLSKLFGAAAAAVVMLTALAVTASAGPSVRSEDGKHYDKNDTVTYDIKVDGTVDWYTYSGFRRYHSECHVCHGPDGAGSTVAPSLIDSLKSLSYEDFFEVVANGREVIRTDKTSKMPALGTNRNVMCYLDDIYVYLKARSDGVLPRGRPKKKVAKSKQAREDEDACIG